MTRWIGFAATLVLAAALGYLAGRTVDQRPSVPSPTAEPPGEAVAPRSGDRVVRAVDSLPSLPQTLLDSAATDLDGDGAPERIELYAAVERDDEGRLMWDDGQRWALVVRDGDLVYHLVNELVQLGELSFWLVDPMGGARPAIVVQRATGAGVRVEKFVYRERARGYASLGVVEASGNVVHETPPKIGS